MKLQFVKLDPTGNTTILVSTPVPRADQPRVAELLMADENLCAEQVGFIEAPTLPGACARLQMAGGEFCGNDSMSLGALLALRSGSAEEETTMIIVTHEMRFAREVSDQVIFMDGGVIVERGDPGQVFDAPQQERTRRFLRNYQS